MNARRVERSQAWPRVRTAVHCDGNGKASQQRGRDMKFSFCTLVPNS